MSRLRLTQWLVDNEISRYRLSQDIGYSQSMISLVLNGKRPFTVGFYLAFAQAYGIKTFLEVFGESVDETERQLISYTRS